MARRLAGACLLVLLCGASSSCATLAHGRSQEIAVRSIPSGARVYLGAVLVGETPARILVNRRDADLVLRIEKDTYQPAAVRLTRSVSGWLVADLAWAAAQFGNQGLRRASDAPKAAASVAVLSMGVDFATGSAYRLSPAHVTVTLTPAPR